MDPVKLSSRTARVSSFVDPVRNSSRAVDANRYHETHNPGGIVDMCMSQNSLISDVILEKLHQPDLQTWDQSMLMYTERRGTKRLRTALASFLTDQTGAPQPLDPDKICIMNGVTGIMNLLSFVLFEEGDTLLCPAPMYYSIPRELLYIANIKTYPVQLSSQPGPNGRKAFELTVDQLEVGLKQATQEGHKVKGMFLVNPSNPLGSVYTREQVLAYLGFCKKHKLQVLMDEIYQCSIHDESVSNSSILGLKTEDIPDPQRTHAMYGFSKDFGLPGAPLAALYTWSQVTLDMCIELNDFQQSSSFIQEAMAKMLEDKEWLNGTYFPTNLSRMRDACRFIMASLDGMGVTYAKPSGGLFIWANLSKFLSGDTQEAEEKLTNHLLKCGVGLSPSAGYQGGEYGWFRVMFAVPRPRLEEGLKRLKQACLSLPSGN